MPVLPSFLLGTLLGVALKWGYDQYRRQAAAESVETAAADPIIQSEMADAPVTIPIVSQAVEPADTIAPSLEAVATASPLQDHFETIKGIGPAFADRLHQAGIHTFADLAQLSVEQLAGILKPLRTVRTVDLESWIDQAQQLITPKA